MLFLTQRAPGHSRIGPSLNLDLVEANRRQLLDAASSPIDPNHGRLHQLPARLYFSIAHRTVMRRMMSVIGIRPH